MRLRRSRGPTLRLRLRRRRSESSAVVLGRVCGVRASSRSRVIMRLKGEGECRGWVKVLRARAKGEGEGEGSGD